MGSVTIQSPAGPYELPDLPTYTDEVYTQPAINAASFDPTTAVPGIIDYLNGWCQLNNGVACAGFSVSQVVNAATAQILAARSSGVPISGGGGGTYYPNTNVSCSPGYVPGPNGNCVLNTVVPTSSPIQIAPTTNVLSAPTGQTPVTQQQLANTTNQGISTGIFAGANASPVPIPSDITTWVETNWPLLAAGAAALFLLSTMRK